MSTAADATIFVIDDEQEIREALCEILEGEGYCVVAARNGSEALESLAAHPRPCVLLTDLMMPVMNGWELLAHLRGNRATADIPVVLVSASDTFPHGANAVVRKPFTVDRLLEVIERQCAVRNDAVSEGMGAA